jgi:hypothetical protein
MKKGGARRLTTDPRSSPQERSCHQYRTAPPDNCKRSRETQPSRTSPECRSRVLPKVLRPLRTARTVRTPRVASPRLAIDRRAHGVESDHLVGPLAVPEVPSRLYRLSRLSYFLISGTLAGPSCTLPAATWRTTGSPTVRRPAPENE